jgi:hypothetical protein
MTHKIVTVCVIQGGKPNRSARAAASIKRTSVDPGPGPTARRKSRQTKQLTRPLSTRTPRSGRSGTGLPVKDVLSRTERQVLYHFVSLIDDYRGNHLVTADKSGPKSEDEVTRNGNAVSHPSFRFIQLGNGRRDAVIDLNRLGRRL